jgi:amino acid transporter
MIGQSIFLVPSQVARDVGSTGLVLASWLMGGAIVLLATFCYAELGATLPQAGGEYVYLRRALGPKWGFLFGWTSAVLQGPAMAAAISAGLMRFTAYFLPSVSQPIFAANIPHPFGAKPYPFTLTAAQVLAAAAIVVVAALNYVGVRTAGKAQILMTALKLAGIVIIVGLGIMMTETDAINTGSLGATRESRPAAALLTALVPIMLAYNGFQTLSQIGGEIAKPGKTLPRATIFGVLAVVVVYLLINVVYIRVLGVSRVASSQHVASDVALMLAGPAGARWLTIIMMLSAFGSLHANFLGRSRIPYAMAGDGQFFAFACRIQPTYRTPSGALIFHGAMAVVLVLTGTYEEIYSLGIFSIWIFVALTATALIRLRKTESSLPRPYRAWGYPWAPLLVAAVALAMSANLWLVRPVRSSIGLAVILVGVVLSGHLRTRDMDNGTR